MQSSQIQVLRESFTFCLMVSQNFCRWFHSVFIALFKRQSKVLENVKVKTSNFSFSRVAVEKNLDEAQKSKKKFQLCQPTLARFFRFAVNVKQPIQPTCGSLFDSSIALESESIHQWVDLKAVWFSSDLLQWQSYSPALLTHFVTSSHLSLNLV